MRFASKRFSTLVVALVALLPVAAVAQARAGDEVGAAPSPLAPAYAQFEDALPPALLGADDSASRWLSGRFASLEPAAQIRDYAAAVAREPKELLYVASLADACMSVAAFTPTECSDRDALSYWTARDADNAVPWLLQAERARRRNNVPSAAENLDRAAKAARYSDYEARAGATIHKKLAALATPETRGAAPLYALDARHASGASLQALENLCSAASRTADPRIAVACVRLAGLMAERAPLFSDRRAGTQIALDLAATESAKAAAATQARAIVAQQDRCREAVNTLRRMAVGSSAQRERASSVGSEFLAMRAREGEPAACDALALAVR